MARESRGRPVEIDPQRIAAIAMELFVANGFDAVTMDEIAVAAGTSRRSVFRYFPSKNHLVWDGMNEATLRLHAALEQLGESESVAESVRHAYVASVTFPPDLVEVTRQRLQLIGSHSALMSFGLERLEIIQQTLAAYIAERDGLETNALEPQVFSQLIVAASIGALIWWANSSDEQPQTVVDRALLMLEQGSFRI
ncbi:acyl-CoA-like ligand-binding transcription factor [Lysinibacter cavernae]|uniref:AcrR family transcriptional regulator n=1 Tax=Lysinibacter cavernae TaxID=1640652 RepID=A0A7X5TT24_9MICO|nr:TetR family transcriptional regulator [Lysinibacter cavernae]NIH54156.1 AcrR family transcriptional regulator [Lysinibacter cavernae]